MIWNSRGTCSSSLLKLLFLSDLPPLTPSLSTIMKTQNPQPVKEASVSDLTMRFGDAVNGTVRCFQWTKETPQVSLVRAVSITFAYLAILSWMVFPYGAIYQNQPSSSLRGNRVAFWTLPAILNPQTSLGLRISYVIWTPQPVLFITALGDW